MHIRVAGSDDWELVRNVRLRSLGEDPDAFCSRVEDEQLFTEDDWRARPTRSHIVLAMREPDSAQAADAPWKPAIGTAGGKADPHEPQGRELVGMWVDPKFRGTGTALELLEEIIRWARADGAASLAPWVAEDNDRARALYEKRGFALTGQREPMRPGVDQVRMRLPL